MKRVSKMSGWMGRSMSQNPIDVLEEYLNNTNEVEDEDGNVWDATDAFSAMNQIRRFLRDRAPFICGRSKEQSPKGLPLELHVCLSPGADWFAVYRRKDPIQPIETAPRDGTHILAWRIPVGIRVTNNTHPPTVVHWFDDPDKPGFYTSVNEIAPEHPFNPTDWMPLPGGPI